MSGYNSLVDCQNRGEKYSLRPRIGDRTKLKIEPGKGEYVSASTNNSSSFQTSKINIKDNAKQKPALLSKYRRKTANARERSRMREINLAFETLRKAVPSYVPQLFCPGDGSNEKLTKITTLRLAMKYITRLTELLHNDESYITDECAELMEQHPIVFRDTDTCTLTALNYTSTYDVLTSPKYLNDGGSDGESLHSGSVTIDNIFESSTATLVPDVNFDFTESFFNPELG
ncbi:helix-loop-helix protein delilah-like isoform X1 [Diprion similis]|uniref:helix-loop-helix protein delilah-like isoform X1 n=1 Tax=Diprion similis TaxID=362088 RepID=UPI001EF90772|nr:helix-loop-helix protein delilah-like isoform X1 [Diprion similis]